MKPRTINYYTDGITARVPNKRISVYTDDRDRITVLMRSVLPKEELRFTGNEILRDKVKQTGFNLTKEGALDLYYVLGEYLRSIHPETKIQKP